MLFSNSFKIDKTKRVLMKIIALLFLVGAVSSNQHTRTHEISSKHEYSWECCQEQGGVAECGLVFKDCCSVDCVKVFGIGQCPDSNRIATECDNYCQNVCTNKGGTTCNNGLIDNMFQCCLQQNCEGVGITNCKPNTLIQVTPCLYKDKVTQIREFLGNLISGSS